MFPPIAQIGEPMSGIKRKRRGILSGVEIRKEFNTVPRST